VSIFFRAFCVHSGGGGVLPIAISPMHEEDEQLLAEEVLDWLQTNLDVQITDLFTDLEDGVLLCRLVEKAGMKVKYRANAKRLGVFHCRDNVSVFLDKCRELGALDAVLFNPDDLVDHKNHRQVVSCLLFMAKELVRFGVSPPSIVKYELEIEALEAERAASPAIPSEATESLESPENEPTVVPLSAVGLSPSPREPESLALPQPSSPNIPFTPPDLPKPPPAVVAASRELTAQVARELQSVDALRHVTFQLVGPGQYVFYDTFRNRTGCVFVRELRGRTIVRVGGGWMSLLKFVLTKFGDSAKLDAAYTSIAENRLRGPQYTDGSEIVAANSNPDVFDMIRVPGVPSRTTGSRSNSIAEVPPSSMGSAPGTPMVRRISSLHPEPPSPGPPEPLPPLKPLEHYGSEGHLPKAKAKSPRSPDVTVTIQPALQRPAVKATPKPVAGRRSSAQRSTTPTLQRSNTGTTTTSTRLVTPLDAPRRDLAAPRHPPPPKAPAVPKASCKPVAAVSKSAAPAKPAVSKAQVRSPTPTKPGSFTRDGPTGPAAKPAAAPAMGTRPAQKPSAPPLPPRPAVAPLDDAPPLPAPETAPIARSPSAPLYVPPVVNEAESEDLGARWPDRLTSGEAAAPKRGHHPKPRAPPPPKKLAIRPTARPKPRRPLSEPPSSVRIPGPPDDPVSNLVDAVPRPPPETLIL